MDGQQTKSDHSAHSVHRSDELKILNNIGLKLAGTKKFVKKKELLSIFRYIQECFGFE